MVRVPNLSLLVLPIYKVRKNTLIWKNFRSYKDWSSQPSHFSLEIFGFVWYVNNSTAYVTPHNDFLGNQEYLWGCQTKSLKAVHVWDTRFSSNQIFISYTLLVDLPTRPFVRDMLLVTLTVIYHIHDKSARLNKAQPNYYSTGKRWWWF